MPKTDTCSKPYEVPLETSSKPMATGSLLAPGSQLLTPDDTVNVDQQRLTEHIVASSSVATVSPSNRVVNTETEGQISASYADLFSDDVDMDGNGNDTSDMHLIPLSLSTKPAFSRCSYAVKPLPPSNTMLTSGCIGNAQSQNAIFRKPKPKSPSSSILPKPQKRFSQPRSNYI
ncbi:unnamed protein product [Heterobilharzia americana]|nr:unnamed protein product [Heterobilharzia americana]